MLNETRRHVILVSGTGSDTKSVAAIMSAMRMTGAIPLLVAEHRERLGGKEEEADVIELVKQDIAKADGIIVMGNDQDIDPWDYNELDVHPKTKSERGTEEGNIRATYEYVLLEYALRAKLPCFAVCGGMQRLNVLLGGNLHQHVPDLTGTHYHHQGAMGIAPFIPVQYVSVIPGTKLATISEEVGGLFTPQQDFLPPGVFMENSFHHQAVNEIGLGLIPCAFTMQTDDDEKVIVQALEADPLGPYKDQFLLGVQWHPEFGASDVSVRSLHNFSEQVKIHAKNNSRNINLTEALAHSVMAGKWKSKNTFTAPASGSKPTKPGKGR